MSLDRRIAAGLFILTFVAYASFFNGAGWNANASFDLTRAVVEDGTLHIDRFAGNTGDVAHGRGHLYSNKPPGLAFLAVVPYAFLHLLGVEDLTIVLWLLTVSVCGTTGAWIPALLFLYGRRAGVSRVSSAIVALTIAFGTYLFAYSTVFFTHVPCAAFVLLALYWLDERPLLAGVAAGVAGTIFYVAIPAVAVLAVLAWCGRADPGTGGGRRYARVALFLAGGTPFAVLLAAYHQAAFGAPWRTSVETSHEFTGAGLAFGVLGMPSPSVLYQLWFSWFRGLLPLSPVLLLALAGVVVMIRRRLLLRELAAVSVMIAIFSLANASFNHWHGGSGIGPRYMLPVVPLLGVPMLFAGHLARPVWILLGGLSFAINFLVVSVDVSPGGGFRKPIHEYIVPVFLTARAPEGYPTDGSHVAVNPQTPEERCAFCTYEFLQPRTLWASFNLGELILPRGSRASVLPMALWIVGGGLALLRLAARADLSVDMKT